MFLKVICRLRGECDVLACACAWRLGIGEVALGGNTGVAAVEDGALRFVGWGGLFG